MKSVAQFCETVQREAPGAQEFDRRVAIQAVASRNRLTKELNIQFGGRLFID
jgi:hypothetical protein